ncbi:hypothetical protein B0H11DRAFT_1907577 [Mycena galericulata]|nr:hypothetical protein B0H11DRAFT_1907577 [Mycena galericulata]
MTQVEYWHNGDGSGVCATSWHRKNLEVEARVRHPKQTNKSHPVNLSCLLPPLATGNRGSEIVRLYSSSLSKPLSSTPIWSKITSSGAASSTMLLRPAATQSKIWPHLEIASLGYPYRVFGSRARDLAFGPRYSRCGRAFRTGRLFEALSAVYMFARPWVDISWPVVDFTRERRVQGRRGEREAEDAIVWNAC